MTEAGRLHLDSAGAIKNKPEAERADAQDQLGPPFVHVWVAFLRSLAATKELGTEHVAVLRQYWESNVVKSALVQLTAHVRHCRAKPCRKIRGQRRVDAGHPPPRGSTGSSTAAAERGEETGPSAKRCSRARSGETPDADAWEVGRLARRVEQHSQRMADLLRRGALEPSMAYAFLMTKGGLKIPQSKSKAKARARNRATTSEGAESAPDKSPPRLPPERPPMVFERGETLEPSAARPKVRISRKSRPRD